MIDSEDGYDIFTGLTDAVSNLMALFILLTMIVLTFSITSVVDTQSGEAALEGANIGEFRTPVIDPVLAPVNYILVTRGGFTVIDWSAIVDHVVLVRGAVRRGAVQLGDSIEATMVIHDPVELQPAIDDYTIEINFDLSRLTTKPKSTSLEDTLDILSSVVGEGKTFSFVVFPDGFEHFIPVHNYLRDLNICFRWEPWEADQPFYRVRTRSSGVRRCPA